jgi:hypothetical protein
LNELGEIKEVMSDVQDIVPVFKDLSLNQMLDAVITKEIVDLEKAIEAKDFKKLGAATTSSAPPAMRATRYREWFCRHSAAGQPVRLSPIRTIGCTSEASGAVWRRMLMAAHDKSR